jgi:outer membrane murein-binding lipoprotein Lpp
MPASQETSEVQHIIETYRAWVETLAGYMERAAGLLGNLYAEQDQTVDQLRKLCAKTHSLRHVDFDAIFGKVLADRGRTRESLSALVDGYRAGREAVIQEVKDMFTADMAQAVKTWPALKQRLLGEKDDGVGEIVAALRQVHIEQEQIATGLSGLLMRGERLKIDDLKTVAQRLASRNSRDSEELAALLAACESAGRDAALRWQRLVA